MAGSVTYLEAVGALTEPALFGSIHPIRKVNNEIAAGQGWSPDSSAFFAEIFDGLSTDWHQSHNSDLRLAPLEDALDRGNVGTGRLVELGCGTGAGTERIVRRLPASAAVDLSSGMLAQADRVLAPFVQADASSLPFPDAAADILVLVNMFLFTEEVDRVLAPAGRIVWVNTMGEETPIHLPPETVVDSLPGEWTAVASRAGEGLWAVVRRVVPD